MDGKVGRSNIVHVPISLLQCSVMSSVIHTHISHVIAVHEGTTVRCTVVIIIGRHFLSAFRVFLKSVLFSCPVDCPRRQHSHRDVVYNLSISLGCHGINSEYLLLILQPTSVYRASALSATSSLVAAPSRHASTSRSRSPLDSDRRSNARYTAETETQQNDLSPNPHEVVDALYLDHL